MRYRLSRRHFLQASSLIAFSPAIPAFLERAARADASTTSGKILVVIQLDGGNDGINTVVPFRDEGYAKHRRVLRLAPDELIRITDDVALHPSLRPAARLLEAGRLAIVQGVGYPNADRSHEVSMNVWHTARTQAPERETFGWIGRSTDGLAAPGDGSPSSLLLGTESPPLALRGRKSKSIAMAHLQDLQRIGGNEDTAGDAAAAATGDIQDLRSFVQRKTLEAYAVAELLRDAGAEDSSVKYPGFRLADRLRMIAQLIKSGFRTPVYYAIHGGFDTHYLQLPDHARLLYQLGAALEAFVEDLRAARLDDRVLVMCFSEFGRRVEENASQGTDHGTAGPVLLAGSGVKPGLCGSAPSLTDLDDGDLKMGIDFRQIYATILDRWLRVPSSAALDGTYEALDVLL